MTRILKHTKKLLKVCGYIVLSLVIAAHPIYRSIGVWNKVSRDAPHSQLQNISHNSGFILTLSYSDQQSGAGIGVGTQRCWLRYFNLTMQIVEPFASDSHLVHNAEIWGISEERNSKPLLRFGDYFNLEHFNRELGGKNLLESWENFILFGPRDIIIVNINYAVPKRQCLSFKRECPALPEYPLELKDVNHFWMGCATDHILKKAMVFLVQKGFRAVREVCLNCAVVKQLCGVPALLSAEDVHRQIFQHLDPAKVTVVFNEWYYRFNFRTGCSNSAPSECLFPTDSAHRFLVPSIAVEQKAKQYIRSVLKSKNVVAVMIRLEWVLAYSELSLHEIKMCVVKALNDVKQFKAKFASSVPFVTTDLGKYGSHTFRKTLTNTSLHLAHDMTKYIQDQITVLYDHDWTQERWENELLNVAGIEDSGYIAQLERTIASRADCLVLVGGGNFQKLAISYYLKKHNKLKEKCVSIWCAGEKTETFKQIIRENVA